jgi:hypothetical protein
VQQQLPEMIGSYFSAAAAEAEGLFGGSREFTRNSALA